jgi:hypothetical protein
MDGSRGIGAEMGSARSAFPSAPCRAAVVAQLDLIPGGRVKVRVENFGETEDMVLLLSAIAEAVSLATGKSKAALLDLIIA